MASDVVAYLAVSLDGYIAEPDGTVSFLDDFSSEEYRFRDFINGVGALVMGSTTYEQVVGFGWPYGDIPVLVLTTRELPVAEGATVQFSSGPTGEAIRSFSDVTDKRMWVVGGGIVVSAALVSNAIDSLELYVMPVALGGGVPLFTDAYKVPRAVVESRSYSNGVVGLVYDTTADGVSR